MFIRSGSYIINTDRIDCVSIHQRDGYVRAYYGQHVAVLYPKDGQEFESFVKLLSRELKVIAL